MIELELEETQKLVDEGPGPDDRATCIGQGFVQIEHHAKGLA